MGCIITLKLRALSTSGFFTLLFVILFSASLSGQSSMLVLVCPNDTTVSCLSSGADLNQFGIAYLEQFGNTVDVEEDNIFEDRNECGAGFVKRYWEVTDMNGTVHTCLQKIYIDGYTPYLNIRWPYDYQLVGCDPNYSPDHLPDYYDEPTILGTPCSDLNINYQDHVDWVNGDCMEIERHWELVDLCYLNNGHGSHFDGVYHHTQVIELSKQEEPTIAFPPHITMDATDCNSGLVDVPVVLVDYDDCGGQYTILHDSPYADLQGYNASGMYPVGTTYVEFKVLYGCFGKSKKKRIRVTVTPGDPIELNIMDTLTLYPDINQRHIDILAEQFDQGSTSLCGEKLDFSFSQNRADKKYRWTRRMNPLFNMEIYVFDDEGNSASEEVVVAIKQNRIFGENQEEREDPITFREKPANTFRIGYDVSSQSLQLFASYDGAKKIQIQLYNIAGAHLLTQEIQTHRSGTLYCVPLMHLKDGMYIVRVIENDQRQLTRKILKM